MAFPGTPTITTYDNGGNTTSWDVFTGVDVPAGNLAVLIVATDGNPTCSEGGGNGWTLLDQQGSGSASHGSVFYYLNATGSTQAKAFTLDTSASERSTAILYIIPPGTAGATLNIDGVLQGFAATANPDPPAFNPGVTRDYKWIAAVATDGSGAPSAAPTGYSRFTAINSGSSAGQSTASGDGDATASSEDPGNFSYGAARAHVAMTLAVWEDVPPAGDGGAFFQLF